MTEVTMPVALPPGATFSDDAPKTNPWEQDKLGYRPFASRVSKVILGLDAPNGYVIGLHGAWGSGKSTALAFVQAFVKKHNDELPDRSDAHLIVDFRPWMVSGHQDLVSAFLKVLAEGLTTTGIVRRHRWWHGLLGFGRKAVGPVIEAAAALAVAAHPPVGAAFKAGSTIVKGSLEAAMDGWLAEQSLQAAYDDLRGKLALSGLRVLVLVDDIDRLERTDIRATMQMVKTVGKLPNVVYLLAYDRRIVWSALDETADVGLGQPSFAEKIVQHELELPRPSPGALIRMLAAEIEFLPVEDGPSNRRNVIIERGVRRWMRQPRDVARLSNAVKFTWPALEGEIDPMDLLCMEGLRLFDQAAFFLIRDNRELLVGDGAQRFMTPERRAEVMGALCEGLPAANRAAQIEILSVLFPHHARSLRGERRLETFSNESWIETNKRHGVALTAGYDAYFSLFPSPEAVSKRTVDAAIAALDDEAALVAILDREISRQAIVPGIVRDFLSHLQYRFMGTDPQRPTIPLLRALFVVGNRIDALDDNDQSFPLLDTAQQLSYFMTTLLGLWGPEDAGRILVEEFERSNTAAFCATVYVRRAAELGVIPIEGYGIAQVITRERLDELGRLLLPMIERAVGDGTLAAAPVYFDILRSWTHLAGAASPRAWLAAVVDASPANLATAARGLLSYSINGAGRRYNLQSALDENRYDLGVLLAACRKHHDASGLTPDQAARVAALKSGLERVELGAQPEQSAGVQAETEGSSSDDHVSS